MKLGILNDKKDEIRVLESKLIQTSGSTLSPGKVLLFIVFGICCAKAQTVHLLQI